MNLKIGAHTFEVVNEAGPQGPDDFGQCSMRELKIYVNPDVPDSLKAETILHEALHIIRELHAIEHKDDELEEQHVQIMGHALYQFLKENNLYEFFGKRMQT
jgi:hypothetical protein